MSRGRHCDAVCISVVGGVNLDVILACEGHVRDDATLEALAADKLPGGHGANVATWAAETGAAASIHAAVGDDAAGEDLVARLRGRGVDVSGVHRLASEPTGRAYVVNSSGEHFMILHRGANRRLAAVWTDRDTAAVVAASCVVLMDCPFEVSDGILSRLAQTDRAARPPVVISPGGRTAQTLRELRPWAAWVALDVICNREEASGLDRDSVEEYLAGGGTLVVTSGAEGAKATTAAGHWRTAARPAAPVDPTGAGDAFTAAYAGAVAKGSSRQNACAQGVSAGAQAVQSIGAWPDPQMSGGER